MTVRLLSPLVTLVIDGLYGITVRGDEVTGAVASTDE